MLAPTVRLVKFDEAYIEATYGWVCDPKFRRDFLMRGEPNHETHQAHFAAVLADKTQRVFAVVTDGAHVGNAGLKHVDMQCVQAELWVYIGEPSARGKGLGSAATAALLDVAFREIGLARIYLHVAEFNMPARRMYERLGFIYEPMDSDDQPVWAERDFEVLCMGMRRDQWT